MGSTQERSFIKGIFWEVVSFILTLLVLYILNRNILVSLKITLILTIIKIPVFYLHERIWKKVKWGKIAEKKIKKR